MCFDELCGYVYWNNLLLVVVVIVEFDGKILFVCNVVWFEGMFVLIIGFFENGEMFEDGIVCEVFEEIVLKVE